jgi:putative hydrolases of HD superfamily
MKNNLENLEKIIEFLFRANKLKETLRYSTEKKFKGDSTADHSWRLSLMVILLVKELKLDIDELKAVKLALVHDLAEAITGDIPYTLISRGIVSPKKKERNEREAMKNFKNSLPKGIGREIFDLWEEFEKITTPEAAFVKTLDKIEAQIYLLPIYDKLSDRETIFKYADPHVKNFPELKPLVAIIKERFKKEFKKHGTK